MLLNKVLFSSHFAVTIAPGKFFSIPLKENLFFYGK